MTRQNKCILYCEDMNLGKRNIFKAPQIGDFFIIDGKKFSGRKVSVFTTG